MDFTKESLMQGLKNQEASAETPDSFSTIDGAAQTRLTSDLDKKNTRMAGQIGARALQLMNDPAAQAANQGWMARFGMSNEGMQFNQAKMMMMKGMQSSQDQQKQQQQQKPGAKQ